YARAAAWILGADRWPEARWADLEAQLGVAKQDGSEAGPATAPAVATARTAAVKAVARVPRAKAVAASGRAIVAVSVVRVPATISAASAS
ncbi:hypothetical protein, partial [Xanthobacter sp.]|uniref:hypothetical protein n=1 Tax=Xanthobacter sp. TaxID=35809 RepID=UPI0035B225B3